MIKLTRLNQHVVAINPDHIGWVETTPDTTLFLLGGEKIIVLESLEELIARVIEFRQTIRMVQPSDGLGPMTGDPPRVVAASAGRRTSSPPNGLRSYRPRGGE